MVGLGGAGGGAPRGPAPPAGPPAHVPTPTSFSAVLQVHAYPAPVPGVPPAPPTAGFLLSIGAAGLATAAASTLSAWGRGGVGGWADARPAARKKQSARPCQKLSAQK